MLSDRVVRFPLLLAIPGWLIIVSLMWGEPLKTASTILLIILGLILTALSILVRNAGEKGKDEDNPLITNEVEEVKKELEKTREFYDMVLGKVPIDIVAFDPTHRYLLLTEKSIKDPALRKWMIGKDDYDYVAYRNKPIEIADKRRALFNVAKESTKATKWEDHNILPDGSDEYLLRMFQPVYDNGELKYMLGVAWDITDQKLAENKMKAAKEEAEKASRTKANFLSMMSHEIRTPMNAVIAMTEWMLSESPREDQKEPLDIIKFSGENLLVLINDILDFSKIEAGKVQFEQTKVDLKQLTNNILSSHRNDDDGKDLKLVAEIDPSLQHYIIGDATRISQVLNNFVSNAVKFTEKGSVTVELKLKEETDSHLGIEFEISDTGIGIAKEKLAIIFKPFSQAESETTRKFGGTGLGLTITKHLLSLMGGDIIVESEPEVGTSFRFHLIFPKGEKITTKTKRGTSKIQGGNLKALKVLAVEDNLVNGKVLLKFLAKWQVESFWAKSGSEALDYLKSADSSMPDVILMDLQMPEMDGYETTRHIRDMEGEFSRVPILALSANAINDVETEVYASGMNGFIPKPFRPSVLFETLEKYNERKTESL